MEFLLNRRKSSRSFLIFTTIAAVVGLLILWLTQIRDPGPRPLFHFGPVDERFGIRRLWVPMRGMIDDTGNRGFYDDQCDLCVIILKDIQVSSTPISGKLVEDGSGDIVISIDNELKKTTVRITCSRSSVVVVGAFGYKCYEFSKRPVVRRIRNPSSIKCMFDILVSNVGPVRPTALGKWESTLTGFDE